MATFLLLAVWTGVEWRGKGLSTGLCGGFGSLALGLLDLASDSCIKVKVVAVSLVDRSPRDVRGRISLKKPLNWTITEADSVVFC